MMRKYLICLISVLICLSSDVVYAADGQLKAEEISLTCVYENGVELNAFYSEGSYGLLMNNVRVVNMIEGPVAGGVTIFYNEGGFAKKIIDNVKCPDQIQNGIIMQGDEAAESTATANVYFHGDDWDKVVCDTSIIMYTSNNLQWCASGSKKFDYKFFDTKPIAQGYTPWAGYWVNNPSEPGSKLASRCSMGSTENCRTYGFNLLNEKVEISTGTKALGQWAFKSEGQQAASKVMYARLYKYKLPNGSVKFFLEKDNFMTVVDVNEPVSSSDQENWMCLNPSAKSIKDSSFMYSSIRHRAGIWAHPAGTSGYGCGDGYAVYKEVDWSEADDQGNGMTSICDVIPETSLILAEFTQWARIIVPAFLIILTGFDISKIVINGNLEEELPKRRKHIIIRAIVALIFFFLPLFVQVIVASTEGVDFGDVSCIWN